MKTLLILLFSLPLLAQQPANHEVTVSLGQSNFTYFGEAPAAGVSYNRFWTRVVSTRAGGFIARDELQEEGSEKRFTALYATAEYHPFRGRLISPRIAAGAAYAASRFKNVYDPAMESDAVSVIGGAGIDFNVTRRFAPGVEVLYIPFTPDSRDRFAPRLDPLTMLVSARFRW